MAAMTSTGGAGVVDRVILPAALILTILAGGMGCAKAATVVTVSGRATELVRPDRMMATLTAQADKSTAAAVQADINAKMGKAMALVRAVPGVKARTADYHVTRQVAVTKRTRVVSWSGRQDLTVTIPLAAGPVPPSFGRLLSRLQSAGLDIETMRGEVSPRVKERMRLVALRAALTRAEVRLHSLSVGLHEPVVGIKSVKTAIVMPPPPFRPGSPVMLAAMARPVQVAPARSKISATVTMTADLRFGPTAGRFWEHFGRKPAPG